MTPKRKQRMILVGLILLGSSLAVAFAVTAFRSSIMLFHSPADVAAGNVEVGKPFRLGGMVVDDSVKRTPNSVEVMFDLTDYNHAVTVNVRRWRCR